MTDLLPCANRDGEGNLRPLRPGFKPQACLFPPRNRIISALSDAVVVIEAREASGTMITVDMALEQGRDVAVVPGRVTDPLSTGCNKLWKQGAVPVTSAEDIMYIGKSLGITNLHKHGSKKDL